MPKPYMVKQVRFMQQEKHKATEHFTADSAATPGNVEYRARRLIVPDQSEREDRG
jgi:hypothetical protein